MIQHFTITFFFFLNSLIHHYMQGQKDSTLTVSKSAEMSGLISRQPWTATLKKGPQKRTVCGITCNIYLEKGNILELFCFTCYLKQVQLNGI